MQNHKEFTIDDLDNSTIYETGICDQCGRVAMLRIDLTIIEDGHGQLNVDYDRPLCQRCYEG